MAVSQFNRGGFVAVSYEGRARGVRKGDGIGEVGQRELKWFQDRPEAVMKEVRALCWIGMSGESFIYTCRWTGCMCNE